MRRHPGRGLHSPFAGKTAAPPSADVTLVRIFDSVANPSRPVRQSPLATSQIQGMPLDLIDRIRSFPLFQTAPHSFLAEIGLLLRPQIHNPNDYILTEGDDAKAMYWVVRGAVAVTSRDGESTYAELKPGAFFGEIGILMDRPRTATVIARTRCLLLALKKEDLGTVLPSYPEVERAIREEAQERLTILEKKKRQLRADASILERRGSKRTRDSASDEAESSGSEMGLSNASKKRKSPSPIVNDMTTSSVLANCLVNVRVLLKELPLFASLPPEVLHFLGLNLQPCTFPPFADIIKQGSMGREIYFIVRGEVEVLDERHTHRSGRRGSRQVATPATPQVKARLKQGQYFGEVVSLALADRRTATVRSVTSVECLMIAGEVFDEFWNRCPRDVRRQVEETARRRLEAASNNDVIMKDVDAAAAIDDLAIGDEWTKAHKDQPPPRIIFNDAEIRNSQRPTKAGERPSLRPSDPDPLSGFGFDKNRNRSRRSSLAPIAPEEVPDGPDQKTTSPRSSPHSSRTGTPSPSDPKGGQSFSDPFAHVKRPRPRHRDSRGRNRGAITDKILIGIFQHLDLHDLLRLRGVSLHWQQLLAKSPELLHYLNLSMYNKTITDEILIKIICPFVGARPRVIDMNNCFHVTDEGFAALASVCGTNVRNWKMKSVWDVTAPAILEMANSVKGLQAIDLSNCRKVSDTLLARMVGWVVPPSPAQHQGGKHPTVNTHASTPQNAQQLPPGTVFGCPELKRITLSYCKHVTDRFMHHIASHAASRIEFVDLTRCTTITDTGFQHWGNATFSRLRKLCLADCTYLTDNAIIYLTNAAKGLQELDLVSEAFLRSGCNR